MSKAPAKIVLAQFQDIPFNKLALSQSNVRRVKAGLSIEELADDIARRGLLQGLSQRSAPWLRRRSSSIWHSAHARLEVARAFAPFDYANLPASVWR